MPTWFYVYVENQYTQEPALNKRANCAVRLRGDKIAYNAQEASATLGISVRSLKRLEERGLIKPCKALRRKIFSRRELERFVEDNS